ncbi:dihydrolipoyl dehydrogenase [Aneurinibacillus sp. Ricciae_BoGa-3]|uniref:dihydrolipoyl dehydrogenase n=1 Tax=Aneurinibacillus sp. Ricciae_BoGa-3 TaxID=3022697 RepID=UPI0023428438|nr:dihydrolipoyl dehydrogenase [Aneurinibacillus sp. Ricciae_BoGa-3]WCK55941.1 dihydrolipoyl dehydrogenase [Aneurinibacillus sp. Ricciae_BoGa-3]
MSNEYDVVILGGGTGGYVAAIRASQLGMKVAIVEKDKLGGTCLHRGCIPSKALLRSAEVYHTLKNSEEYGITAVDIGINFTRMQERKQKIVDQLHKGVQHLMKSGKIDIYEGTGRIMGPSIFSPQAGAINIEYPNGDSEIVVPKFVLIATGSRPRLLPGLEVDGTVVITSDEALQLAQLPSSVVIVGGGVIGIEWASLLADLGVKVEVVEFADRILPLEDEEVSKEMARLLKKRKITLHTSAQVLPETLQRGERSFTIKAMQNGKEIMLSGEKLFVSVGRQANIEDIGLNNVEAEIDRGVIKVNPMYQTGESHIYAIGDVIGGLQLAHVASHEGITAIEHMAGRQPEPINYTMVAKCTYSRPEVANVGLTEAEAKEKGYKVKVGKFNFRAIGKALVFGEHDGFVKLVVDEETDDLLGVHMIGPHVTDLISEGALARVLDATPWELAHTIHPHPTLSEIIGEAALAVDGKAIHS